VDATRLVSKKSTGYLMLDTISEVETETRGRGLHKLKLMSYMGKSESEVTEASGNVDWGTDGNVSPREAL
jgi:hypothetical protein